MYINKDMSINQFYDANEGFIKGNMFKTIYKPYKNFVPKEVRTNNQKEALLLFIQKCELAIQDLNLYLDIAEKDEETLKLLNFYKEELSKARDKYLNNFGQLLPCQQTSSFKWNDNPFPWEE